MAPSQPVVKTDLRGGPCQGCSVLGKYGIIEAQGDPSSPICIVLSPGRDAIETGSLSSSPTMRILANALAQARVNMDDCYFIPLHHGAPEGDDGRPTPEQLARCAERFKHDLANCGCRAVLLLGPEALQAVLRVTGTKNSLSHWRGYPLDPTDFAVELPVRFYGGVATFHPDTVRSTGFKYFPAFAADVYRLVQLSRGKLGEVYDIATSDSCIPESTDLLGVDVETDGFLGAVNRVGISWAGPDDPAASLAVSEASAAKALIESDCLKIIQNGAFDIPHLHDIGWKIRGPYWDTMYAAQLIDPDAPGFSLDQLIVWALPARRHKHLGAPGQKPRVKIQTWKREFICANNEKEGMRCKSKGKPTLQGTGKGANRICKRCAMDSLHREIHKWELELVNYNRQDARVLLPIYRKQRAALAQLGLLELFETMMDVFEHVLIPMQMRGIKVDPAVRERLKEELGRERDEAQAAWDELTGGVNPGSTPQMRKLVYEDWRLPKQYKFDKKRKIQKLALDNEAIENLVVDDRVAPVYRDGLRTLQKLKRAIKWYETYVRVGDRIFPRYGPAKKDDGGGQNRYAGMAATGRIIAKGGDNMDGTKTPPIQQFPEGMKDLVISEFGKLIAWDYSQQELRIVAYLANDPALIGPIESGEDLHAINAERFKCDRTRAKNLFYGAVFGGGARALVRELRAHGFDLTISEADDFLGVFRSVYQRTVEWHSSLLGFADRHHYIGDPFGGRRNFPERGPRRSEVLNFPVQSTGSRMQWLRLREIRDTVLRHRGDLVLLQFDSVVADVPEVAVPLVADEVKQIMERPFPQVHPRFYCPVDCKVGASWGSMEELVL